jgi:dipeptidyl aminopeptidase/acylaminoacyl peptidase
MKQIVLLVAACCALVCVLGLAIGGSWFVLNWDRIPNVAAGDSYDDWSSGGSMPWPGGGPSPTTDGSNIAYSSPRSGRGDIYVWNRATGNSRQLTNNDDFEGQPAFSPNSERIVYQRQEHDYGRWRIWIMNADGSQQQPVSKPRRGNDSYPEFVDNGKRIRFLRSTWEGGLGQRAEFIELDLASGAENPARQLPAEQVSDEGDTWAVGATWDGQVWIREKGTGNRRVIAEGAYPLLMNGESEVLYAGQYARGLWVVGIDGSNRRKIFDNPGYMLMEPQRHSGSKVVVIVDALGSDRSLQLWEVDASAETSQLLIRTD